MHWGDFHLLRWAWWVEGKSREFKFSNDTSHIINLSTCQHLAKKERVPVCWKHPSNLVIVCAVLKPTTTITSYKTMVSPVLALSKIRRLFTLLLYFFFLHTACLFKHFLSLSMFSCLKFGLLTSELRFYMHFHVLTQTLQVSIHCHIFM